MELASRDERLEKLIEFRDKRSRVSGD